MYCEINHWLFLVSTFASFPTSCHRNSRLILSLSEKEAAYALIVRSGIPCLEGVTGRCLDCYSLAQAIMTVFQLTMCLQYLHVKSFRRGFGSCNVPSLHVDL